MECAVTTPLDPAMWTPSPTSDAGVEGLWARSASGREEAARRLVVRWIDALRRSDEGAFLRTLADPLIARNGGQSTRSSAGATWLRTRGLADEFDIDGIQTRLVGTTLIDRIRSSIRTDDVIVRIPRHAAALRPIPFAISSSAVEVIVRVEEPAHIIGY